MGNDVRHRILAAPSWRFQHGVMLAPSITSRAFHGHTPLSRMTSANAAGVETSHAIPSSALRSSFSGLEKLASSQPKSLLAPRLITPRPLASCRVRFESETTARPRGRPLPLARTPAPRAAPAPAYADENGNSCALFPKPVQTDTKSRANRVHQIAFPYRVRVEHQCDADLFHVWTGCCLAVLVGGESYDAKQDQAAQVGGRRACEAEGFDGMELIDGECLLQSQAKGWHRAARRFERQSRLSSGVWTPPSSPKGGCRKTG